MKKIIFLLSIFLSLSGSTAFAVWDDTFGEMMEVNIPHISSFADSQGVALDEIKLDVGAKFNSLTIKYKGLLDESSTLSESSIQVAIGEALQSAGVSWLVVKSFRKSTDVGLITFDLNITDTSLPVLLRTANGSVYKIGIVPILIKLTVDKPQALPDEDLVFMASNLRPGRNYTLQVVQASTGDPEWINFRYDGSENRGNGFVARTKMQGEAEYQLVMDESFLASGNSVKSNICETRLAWPFYSLIETTEDASTTISSDGYTLQAIRRYRQENNAPFTPQQQYIMERVCKMYGHEKYNWLNRELTVVPIYDAEDNEYVLTMTATPNASWDPIYFNLALDENAPFIMQEGGFEVYDWCTVEGEKLTEPYERHRISVSGVQQGVTYILYKDYTPVRSLVCTENEAAGMLYFDNINANGEYTVAASCSGNEWSLSGSYTVSDAIGVGLTPSYSHNFQIVHDYVEPDVKNSSIVYSDALGRQLQSIEVNATPDGKDIVSFVEYDNMGRKDAQVYLPFAGDQNGLFYVETDPSYTNESFSGLTYMQESYWTSCAGWEGSYAYTEKVYDQSPLGVVLQTNGLGQNAHSCPLKYSYGFNSKDEKIKKFQFEEANNCIWYQEVYGDGELTVIRTKQFTYSSDRPLTTEYKDSEGRLVAKRMEYDKNDIRTTYFVYDEMGRERYVIPHIQAEQMNSNRDYAYNELSKYCYYTEYDEFNNVVKKYVPGAEEELSVYDKRGRLVLSQSGNLRSQGQWLFTKYDDLNRTVMTGILSGGTYEEHLQAVQSQTQFGETRGDALHGYTNNCYPTAITANDVLTVSYYDDYAWLANADYEFLSSEGLNQQMSSDIVSMATGTKTKVLGIDENRWLTSVVYYDDKYNTIQTITELFPSGKEITSNLHDWSGKVIQTKVKQISGAGTHEYNKWFDYDSRGRLLSIRQHITGDPRGEVVIASYDYDDMDQVVSKSVHNGLDETSFEYSVEGHQIASVSKDFTYNVEFDYQVTDVVSYEDVRYAGNIKRLSWKDSDGIEKSYLFDYDKSNQMIAANMYDKVGGSWTLSNKFAEKGISYDKNGNILTMLRTDVNGNPMYDIEYLYQGNQLYSLKLNGEQIDRPFNYDANGNMIYDGHTGVSIKYNILNLPEEISVDNNEKIRYIYNASGTKLATDVDGYLTYYRTVMVYNKPLGGSEQLAHMIQPEGIVQYNSTKSDYTYKYFKADLLGSTRAVLAANWDGVTSKYSMDVEQSTAYYPFGLAHELNDLGVNKYLFSGKEIQDANIGSGILGLYDFGSRYYNPFLGRWFNIDPALQMTNPYVYCGNNPAMYVDPDGEFFSFFVGFFKGLFKGENPFKTGWTHQMNTFKILGGMFIGESFWDVLSKWTWELPQHIAGVIGGYGVNLIGDVKVDYWGGATTIAHQGGKAWGGFTLGSYIQGDYTLEADPNNTLFQHEYGHYLQSKASGPLYLAKYAIPSLYDAAKDNVGTHWAHPTEQDANARALKYFEKRYPGFAESRTWENEYGWDHGSNKIIGYEPGRDGGYHNPENQRALKNAKLKAYGNVWDVFASYLSYGLLPLQTFVIALPYEHNYRKMKEENLQISRNIVR